MYVRPELRRTGLGRRLLDQLESRAIAAGFGSMILETAVKHVEALGLYTQSGYMPIASYVPGRDLTLNRAFKKSLTGAA